MTSQNSFELTIERIFDAPRELVFECWSTAEHMQKWSGPKGYTIPQAEIEFEVGGKYRVCLRSPEGAEFWTDGVYREIVPPEKIVLAYSFENADVIDGAETVMTLTFTEENGKTKLTVHQTGFATPEARDGHESGWSETLAKLTPYLDELQQSA